MKCLGLGNDLKVIKVSIDERTKKMTTPQTYISILGHTLENNNKMATRLDLNNIKHSKGYGHNK